MSFLSLLIFTEQSVNETARSNSIAEHLLVGRGDFPFMFIKNRMLYESTALMLNICGERFCVCVCVSCPALSQRASQAFSPEFCERNI